jgi:hypothetical protein
MVNISLGYKLLWRLVTGDQDWWKSLTLLKKYFSGIGRCLDHPPTKKLGLSIWKFLWASLPFFSMQLDLDTGNGRDINIWNDSILGFPPLIRDPSFFPLWRIVGKLE